MADIDQDVLRLKNEELFNVWLSEKNPTLKPVAVANFVMRNFDENAPEYYIKHVRNKSRIFCVHVKSKWSKADRNKSAFLNKFKGWLQGYTIFEKTGGVRTIINNNLLTPRSAPVGRPKLPFSDKSIKSQKRVALKLSRENEHDSSLIVSAAVAAATASGNKDLSCVLRETTKSPTRASKIRKVLFSTKDPIKYTPQEALSFLLDNRFTKQQYIAIRLSSKNRNCDIYPSYQQVLEAKSKCRPNNIEITENLAKVPLQDLLSHTTNRIFILQEDVVSRISIGKHKISATLVASYGFDGSSGHSEYKQKFLNEGSQDSSIFATTLIPLRLTTSNGVVIWNNLTPQSLRFCRPIKLQYAKETKEHIMNEKNSLEKEIQNLKPLEFTVHGCQVIVDFHLCLTLIDGKVLSTLTGTKSSQACPICGATPAKFLTITDFTSDIFKPKEGALQYGISPLHCWIRFFECVIHVSYRLNIKMWQVRGETNKAAFAEQKKIVQRLFWEKLSLHVDKPKSNGFGSTNDGNTARKAFSNYNLFSDITGVSCNLIKRFWIILVSMACQLPLNFNKFEIYCFETGHIFMELYPWFPMPASLHKVLIHNKQIMKNCILPVGCLGEEASESRNKIYKQDREYHARKNSRVNNLTDIFQRALDTSDPLISSLSLQSRRLRLKIKKLPEEVLNLLESYAQPENPNITTDDSQSDALELESFLETQLDSLELHSELNDI